MPNERLTLEIVATTTGQDRVSALTGELKKFSGASEDAGKSGSSLGGSAKHIGESFEHTVPQMAAASAAVRAFEGTLSVRAVERFLTGVLQIGPALQAAFPVIGALAFGAVLVELGGKIGELAKKWDPIIHAEEQAKDAAKEYGQEIAKIGEEIRNLNLEALEGAIGKVGAKALGADQLSRQAFSDRGVASILQSRLAEKEAGARASEGASKRNGESPTAIAQAVKNAQQYRAEADSLRTELAYFQTRAVKEEAQASKLISESSQAQIDINDKRTDDAKRAAEEFTHQAEALERQVAAYGKIGNLAGSSPIEKLLSGRDEQLSTKGLSSGQKGRIGSSAIEQIEAELKRQSEAAGKLQLRSSDLGGDSSGYRFISKFAQSEESELNTGLDRNAAATLKQLKEAASIYDEIQKKAGQQQARSIDGEASFRSRLVALSPSLNSGQRAAAQYQIEKDAADKKYQSELKTASLLTYEKEQKEAVAAADLSRETDLQKIKEDGIIRLSELENQKLGSFRNAIGGLFDSILGGGSGVSRFLESQLQSVAKTVFTNAATSFVYPELKNLIPRASDPNSQIGKLFKDTPFGADPTAALKTSTELNTAATDANTLALKTALSGPGRAGVGGGLAPGVIDTGSIFGGSTANPYVFNAVGEDGLPIRGVGNAATLAPGIVNPQSGLGFNAKTVGAVTAAAGGGFAAFNDFKTGGAKNDVAGVGALLGSAAAITALIPGGQVVALGLGIASAATSLIAGLLPDPKKVREAAISKELTQNRYLAPTALNVTQDGSGNYEDFDSKGNLRQSPFRAVPQVSQPYTFYKGTTPYDVPGGVTSPYQPTPAPQIYVTIHANDAASFSDMLARNPHAVADAAATSLQDVHARLTSAIQYVAGR